MDEKCEVRLLFYRAGLVFFAVVIALGMAEIISTQQILLLGQGYALLLLVATLIQMIARGSRCRPAPQGEATGLQAGLLPGSVLLQDLDLGHDGGVDLLLSSAYCHSMSST
jgi:hypothetical protein